MGYLYSLILILIEPFFVHFLWSISMVRSLAFGGGVALIYGTIDCFRRYVQVPVLVLISPSILAIHQFFWLALGPRHSTANIQAIVAIVSISVAIFILGLMPLISIKFPDSSFFLFPSLILLLLSTHFLFLRSYPTKNVTQLTNRTVALAKNNKTFPNYFLDPFTLPLDQAIRKQSFLLPSIPSGRKIFVLVLDSFRNDFYGEEFHGISLTPNLETLSPNQSYFSNFRVQVPFTKGSIASFFTGNYLREHGVYKMQKKEPTNERKEYRASEDPNQLRKASYSGHVLPQGERTLAERLQHSGYESAGFVQIEHINDRFGFGQGFDHYTSHPEYNRPPGTLLRKVLFWILREQPSKAFVYVHLKGPHTPYYFAHQNPIIWERSPYFQNRTVNPPQWDLPSNQLADLYQKKLPDDFNFNLDDEKDFIRHYYASELKSYDQFFIPKYKKSLKNLNVWSKTFFAVTSDHGEGIFDHDQFFGHSLNLYEEAINVPLVLKPPSSSSVKNGRKQNHSIDENLQLIDLTATILATSGQSDSYISGKSFHSTLYNRDASGTNPISFSEKPNNGAIEEVAAVYKNWKYIYNLRNQTGELYNLKKDPSEQNPLQSHPKLKKKLQNQIIKNWGIRGSIQQAPPVRELTPQEKQSLKGLGYLN